MPTDRPLRIFISYSNDSTAHANHVRELANDLRATGYDAWIDQFEVAPPEGWPRWMLKQVEQANFMLCVATPTYRTRAELREAMGIGLGATWESSLAIQALYESQGQNLRIFALLWDGEPETSIPKALRPYTFYRWPSGREALLRHFEGRPPADPAPLGTRRPLGPIQPIAPETDDNDSQSSVLNQDQPEERDPSTLPFNIEAYYVNQRRVAELVGAEEIRQRLGPYDYGSSRLGLNLAVVTFKDAFLGWLQRHGHQVVPVEILVVTGRLRPGTMFMHYGHMFARNVRVLRQRGPPVLHTRLLGLPSRRLELHLHQDHVAPGSAGDMLSSNVPDAFVVGTIDGVDKTQDVTTIRARPIVIGRMRIADPDQPTRSTRRCSTFGMISFSEIAAFEGALFEARPRQRDLNLLKAIPAADLNGAITEILGEEVIPSTRNGEWNDLVLTHAIVQGIRVSVAILQIGQLEFHKLQLADLGHNGDAIARLADESADLLVLRHNHEVATPVKKLLQAYACQLQWPRPCCTIDGYGTIRLLRAYGKLGFTSVPRRPPKHDPADDYYPEPDEDYFESEEWSEETEVSPTTPGECLSFADRGTEPPDDE